MKKSAKEKRLKAWKKIKNAVLFLGSAGGLAIIGYFIIDRYKSDQVKLNDRHERTGKFTPPPLPSFLTSNNLTNNFPEKPISISSLPPSSESHKVYGIDVTELMQKDTIIVAFGNTLSMFTRANLIHGVTIYGPKHDNTRDPYMQLAVRQNRLFVNIRLWGIDSPISKIGYIEWEHWEAEDEGEISVHQDDRRIEVTDSKGRIVLGLFYPEHVSGLVFSGYMVDKKGVFVFTNMRFADDSFEYIRFNEQNWRERAEGSIRTDIRSVFSLPKKLTPIVHPDTLSLNDNKEDSPLFWTY